MRVLLFVITNAAILLLINVMFHVPSALQHAHEPDDLPGEFSAFGINSGDGLGLKKLFMSHPPLAGRINALQTLG